jgi:7,8-dihydropterin-6-yl-methyl-4-(beta-D-ribofuranosyl)aminobenzene 5'-phosphate synthase
VTHVGEGIFLPRKLDDTAIGKPHELHPGIVNTMEYARELVPGAPVHAVLGGFHLLALTDEKVDWTGGKMQEFGVQHVLGAHCTGINAVKVLRDSALLGRDTSVVGAVGSVFTLEGGIQRGMLNR